LLQAFIHTVHRHLAAILWTKDNIIFAGRKA
jgi:hypothetical protein